MEEINELLKKLGNKVPSSIAKRLDGLKKLNDKLAISRKEHYENPTQESQEVLNEIIEFITDTQDDLKEDLGLLVEQKRSAELKLQEDEKKRIRREAIIREEARLKKAEEARLRAEKEAESEAEKERLRLEAEKINSQTETQTELQNKQSEEEALKSAKKTKDDKKSGFGWGGLLLGGALLVLTGGVVKYFGNKK